MTNDQKNTHTEDPAARIERLRKILLQKRAELLRESQAGIKRQLSSDKMQSVETVLDDADLSVMDVSEDINLRQLSLQRNMLLKIDTALRKLAEGTYGQCDECGEEISVERLKILPFAIYCRDCQETRERMEKLEEED